jgi:uncharacterized membrane-anchored protein YjiN (DUF445 family)
VTTKASPPGWEAHKIISRIDGWVVDPNNEDRIPAAVAEMITQAMPQLSGRDVVAVIRARMMARQQAHERMEHTRIARQRMLMLAKRNGRE